MDVKESSALVWSAPVFIASEHISLVSNSKSPDFAFGPNSIWDIQYLIDILSSIAFYKQILKQ